MSSGLDEYETALRCLSRDRNRRDKMRQAWERAALGFRDTHRLFDVVKSRETPERVSSDLFP